MVHQTLIDTVEEIKQREKTENAGEMEGVCMGFKRM